MSRRQKAQQIASEIKELLQLEACGVIMNGRDAAEFGLARKQKNVVIFLLHGYGVVQSVPISRDILYHKKYDNTQSIKETIVRIWTQRLEMELAKHGN